MTQIQHQFDKNYKPETGSLNEEPSMTVPDQSLSIREILQNSINGLDHTIMQEGQYFDTPIPRIRDLTDIQLYKDELRERQEDLDHQIREYNELNRPHTPKEEKNLLKPAKQLLTEGDSLT